MRLRVRTLTPVFSLLVLIPIVICDAEVDNEPTGNRLQDFLVESNFKIVIHPRTAECFYNNYSPNNTAYLSYEVIDGGDRKIDVSFKDLSHDIILFPDNVDSISDFKEYKFSEFSIVEYCFKNYRSSFQKKLMSLGMYRTYWRNMTYKDKREKEMYEKSENFTTRFSAISEAIRNISMSATHSSIKYVYDFMAMKRNRDYVQYWAIFHVILILGTSFLQVYFLRHFFRDPSGGKKPRV